MWYEPNSGEHYATAAGIVLLAKDPSAVFPQCRILADAYRGAEPDGDPRDHEDIRAPMPIAIERAIAFIDRNTRHPMRVVGLNSQDSLGGRIFTMLHELCHIVIRNGGVCDLGDDGTEVFCNRVAGAALIPAEHLLREPVVTRTADKEGWADAAIQVLATRYGVSREVALRRLLLLGRTTEAYYRAKRDKVAAHKAMMLTNTGFTAGAVAAAKDDGIALDERLRDTIRRCHQRKGLRWGHLCFVELPRERR